MSRRRFEAGMTLTELMIVVVIVGVLAATARPMFRRDRVKREAEQYAAQLARDLQRLRFTAIAERLPQRAFVYSDRVEFRSAVPAPDVNDPPTPAATTHPTQRVITAPTNVTAWEVRTVAGTPAASTLTTASQRTINFDTTGVASVVGVAGTRIAIFVRNANSGVGNAHRDYRIEIQPLTGHVTMVEAW